MKRWMTVSLAIAAVTCVALAGTWVVAHQSYREGIAEAEAAWADIASRAALATDAYRPEMVDDLPEIARRYFDHAMAPGTSLATTVELAMEGSFLLGDAGTTQAFEMSARQILAPPGEFVWIAEMMSGPMIVGGADLLHRSRASMRFWMFEAIPLVQVVATEGLDRSAAVRPVLEAIWAPASLLPANGARWEQVGPNKARVTFDTGPHPVEMTMTIGESGRVLEVVAMRWSDANPDKVFRLQPFGAAIEDEASFDGFTIPSVVHVGNNYGTDAYFPFFNAQIVGAKFY